MRSPRRITVVVLIALLGLVGLACGSDGTSSASDTSSAPDTTAAAGDATDAAVAKEVYELLPDDIKSAGRMVFGSNVGFAPFNYYDTDGSTVLGIDADLRAELARYLGVDLVVEAGAFPTLIPGLTAGRFDALMTGFGDTPERQQTIDFVDYLRSGAQLFVNKGNPENIKGLDDLCGKPVTVTRGSYGQPILEEQSEKCVAAGKAAIDIQPYDELAQELLQMKSGRAVADITNAPVAVYIAETTDGGSSFDVVPGLAGRLYYGIGVQKGSTELVAALEAAFQAIIDDGSYAKVLAKWGITDSAVPSPLVNAGGTD